MEFSVEQRNIIESPNVSCSVIACAGSGKTITAVQRLYSLRQRLIDEHTRIALLSFTNVAIDTFRSQYRELVGKKNHKFLDRVTICTLDSFLVQNLLFPHGYLVMNCQRRPFLINGNEKFLKSSVLKGLSINDLKFGEINGKDVFFYKNKIYPEADELIKKLGKMGAYTHELGRYWVYSVLQKYPSILKALAQRYKNIIIDEAQDISFIQSKILLKLKQHGVILSLIGDPMQAIYEFNGSDGKMLKVFNIATDVSHFYLTQNYRSDSKIQDVANYLSGRKDNGVQKEKCVDSLLFIKYEKDKINEVLSRFNEYLRNTNIKTTVCLVRGKNLLFGDTKNNEGESPTKFFVKAMFARDYLQDFAESYNYLTYGFLNLFDSKTQDIFPNLLSTETTSNYRKINFILWNFIRDFINGLPKWTTDEVWIDKLRSNIKSTLMLLPKEVFSEEVVSQTINSVNRKITRKKLNIPELVSNFKKLECASISIPKCTVHKVKGDEFDAVIYLMTEKQLRMWKKDIDNEEGRINYVALTRAKRVFCAALPMESYEKYAQKFVNLGFKELKFPNT